MADNSLSFEEANKPASLSLDDAMKPASMSFDDAIGNDAAAPSAEAYAKESTLKRMLMGPVGVGELGLNMAAGTPGFIVGVAGKAYGAGKAALQGKSVDEIAQAGKEGSVSFSDAVNSVIPDAVLKPHTNAGAFMNQVAGDVFQAGTEGVGRGISTAYGSLTGQIGTPEEYLKMQEAQRKWSEAGKPGLAPSVEAMMEAQGEKYAATKSGKMSQFLGEAGAEAAMAFQGVKGGFDAYKAFKKARAENAATNEEIATLRAKMDQYDATQQPAESVAPVNQVPGGQGELNLQGPATSVEAIAQRRALNSPQQDMFLPQEPYGSSIPQPRPTTGPDVQGKGVMYGDTAGNMSPELATRLREDPQALEAYRIAQQGQLEAQQRAAITPEGLPSGQQGLFDVQQTKVGPKLVEQRLEGAPPEQLPLDMGQGKPTEVGARAAENVTPETLPNTKVSGLSEDLAAKDDITRSDTASNFDIVGRPKVDFNGFLTDLAGLAKIKFNPLDNSFHPQAIFDAIRAANDSVHPDLREVADKLEKLLNQLPESEKPKFMLNRQNGAFQERVQANGKPANALYKPYEHQVVFGTTGFNARTFLHETVHALTARSLNLYERAVGTENVKGDPALLKKLEASGINLQALRNMFKLYDTVKKHAKMQNENAYGVTNVHEMAAESMASPYFQEFLSTIHAPGFAKLASGAKNAFEAFKGIIGNMFEKRVFAADNAFGRTIDMLHDAMSDYAMHAKIVGELFKENFSPAGPHEAFENAMKSPERQMAEATKIQKTPEELRAEHTANIPGLEFVKKEYIPTAPKLEDVKSQLQAGSDMKEGLVTKNTIGSKFVVGNTMQALLQNNHGINLFGKMFEVSRKLSDYYSRVRVNPLEDRIRDLGDKASRQLKEIMIREMYNKKLYSPEELKGFGLTKDQIDAYTHIRTEQVASLKAMNDVRAKMGLDQVTPADAYLTSKWKGDWKTPVFQLLRDEAGKVIGKKQVGWISEDTRPAAMSALKYLQKRNPDIAAETPTYRKGFSMPGKDMIGAYSDLARVLGKDDPAVKQVEAMLKEYYEGQGYEFRGQPRHFEPKTNMGGFLGDRPWANPIKDNREFWQAQMQQMRQAHEWAQMQDATDKASKILNDKDLLNSHPNTLNYLRDYASIQMGFGEDKLVRAVESRLVQAQALIMSRIPLLNRVPSGARNISGALGFSKDIFYIMHLGLFKPQTFIVNGIIQNIFNLPKHLELSAQGYKHSALANLAKTGADAGSILFNHWGQNVPLSGFAREMMTYLESNGIVVNQFAESHDLRQTENIHMAKKIAGMSMSESERIVRTNAFVSFAHHLADSGKFSDNMSIFQKAEDMVNDTHGNFRSGERAMFFNQAGLAGKSLNTLKTFSLNQLNQLAYYGKLAQRTGNYAPLVALIGIQFTLAGTLGMWGVQTLGNAWDALTENLPSTYAGAAAIKWLAENNPRKRLMELTADTPWITHGGLSALTGINFSSSLDSSAVVSADWKDMLPVIADSQQKWDKAKGFLLNPNKETGDQALYQYSPDTFKGYLDTHLSSFTSPSGASTSPTNPGNATYTRGKGIGLMSNVDEKTIRIMGLMSAKEAHVKEENYQASITIKQMEDRRKEEEDKLMSAMRTQDDKSIVKHLNNYITFGGNPQSLNPAVKSAYEKWNLDARTRLLKGAKGYEGAQNYMLIQKLINGPTK